MTVKPSSREEQYFHEQELKRRLAKAREEQAAMADAGSTRVK